MTEEFHLRMARLFGAFGVLAALSACSAMSPSSGDGDEPRTVEVRMGDDLRFSPDAIAVAPGETVRFELINEGEAVHEFLIGDEAAQAEFEQEMAGGMHHETDAGVSVDPGQTAAFEYTFSESPGGLLAGCHEPGHYDGGMVATFTATE